MRSLSRSALLTTGLLVATVGLAACGGSDDAATDTPASSMAATEMATTQAAAQLVGAGCAAYAEQVPDGAGSVQGMAQGNVVEAASNNPLLTTLTSALSGGLNPDVNLVDTLNGGEFTVFAPVDEAFAKVPAANLTALKSDDEALTSLLTYHVVPGQLSPAQVAGEHTTVEGGTLTVAGSGDSLTVNDASVICGGVTTTNATVYLIDEVLTPAP